MVSSRFACFTPTLLGWLALVPLLLVNLISGSLFASEEQNFGTRFVVLGHLYPIIDSQHELQSLLGKINEQDPDLIFILGDSSLHRLDVVSMLRKELQSEIYFVPGNNDISGPTQDNNQRYTDYVDNIGYVTTVVIRDDIQFILINSSASGSSIKSFLEKTLNALPNNKHTSIMAHHRIWDDTLMSSEPFMHDKSYYFDTLFPVLEGRVDTIFAGNSKRQYFSDFSGWENGRPEDYGPQNVNNVYWVDLLGSITCYSVGMGDGIPKATFVSVDVIEDKLLVTPHYVPTSGYDVLPRSKIQFYPGSAREFVSDKISVVEKPQADTVNETLLRYVSVVRNKHFLLGILFGLTSAAGLAMIFLLLTKLGRKPSS